jgi:hypothetical protein
VGTGYSRLRTDAKIGKGQNCLKLFIVKFSKQGVVRALNLQILTLQILTAAFISHCLTTPNFAGCATKVVFLHQDVYLKNCGGILVWRWKNFCCYPPVSAIHSAAGNADRINFANP